VETERLLLRRWRDSDRLPLVAMNADPVVMEHYVAPWTEDESDAFLARERDRVASGLGQWVVEVRGEGGFAGYVGMTIATFDAPFTPVPEIGWRLAHQYWGHGYATEAARAVLEHGFTDLGFDEIVAFTTTGNLRSRRVMEKLGMTHDPAEDFDHPNVPSGHPIRRHVLYRLTRPASGYPRRVPERPGGE
jgi:RimJ/RimL family protein N-acetyltransferase